MGFFDRLFGRKTEQPVVPEHPSPPVEMNPELQQKQKETEAYIARRGLKPRTLNEEDLTRIHEKEAKKKQKKVSGDERQEKKRSAKVNTDPPNVSIPDIVVPKLLPIGNVDPICPYCGAHLEKMPERKKKCPHCGKYIFARTRPFDRKRVLIKEEQIGDVKEQWEIKYDLYAGFKLKQGDLQQEIDTLQRTISEKSGKVPNYSDLVWQTLNRKAIEYASNYDMGLYRNMVMEQANFLKSEKRLKDALLAYMEVCYLDINGTCNRGGFLSNPKILKEYPLFDPKLGFLAPGILGQIVILNKYFKLTKKELKLAFIEYCTFIQKSLKLPVSPKDAWVKIESELELPTE